MPNYKQMYLELLHATEQAIVILEQAQKNAEEIYITSCSKDIDIADIFLKKNDII